MTAERVTHALVMALWRRGDVWDNSAMESFFASFRKEWAHRRNYATRDEARANLFDYRALLNSAPASLDDRLHESRNVRSIGVSRSFHRFRSSSENPRARKAGCPSSKWTQKIGPRQRAIGTKM